jgi:hypothetical protein
MFNLTYRELLELLKNMPADTLDQTAVIYLPGQDEFFSVVSASVTDSDEDRLDEGHLYLSIDD